MTEHEPSRFTRQRLSSLLWKIHKNIQLWIEEIDKPHKTCFSIVPVHLTTQAVESLRAVGLGGDAEWLENSREEVGKYATRLIYDAVTQNKKTLTAKQYEKLGISRSEYGKWLQSAHSAKQTTDDLKLVATGAAVLWDKEILQLHAHVTASLADSRRIASASPERADSNSSVPTTPKLTIKQAWPWKGMQRRLTDVAKLLAKLTGKSERTIRGWSNEFAWRGNATRPDNREVCVVKDSVLKTLREKRLLA